MTERTVVARGSVVAVCRGDGGLPNRPVDSIQVTPQGVVGDKHRGPYHGGANRAVCLFSTGDYESLRRDGVDVDPPGTFGENFLLSGIAFEDLRAGDVLTIGSVQLEIHDIREPCVKLKAVDERMPQLLIGRSGFVCRVLEEGEARAGQDVVCERPA